MNENYNKRWLTAIITVFLSERIEHPIDAETLVNQVTQAFLMTVCWGRKPFWVGRRSHFSQQPWPLRRHYMYVQRGIDLFSAAFLLT